MQKVLSFKKELRDGKEFYYHDFDDSDSFVLLLRRHLAQWLRDYEKGESGKVIGAVPSPPAPTQPEVEPIGEEYLSQDEKEMVGKAQEYANEGKLLEAEEWFARAAIKGNNPAAVNEYGLFLIRIGRLSQVTVMFERVLELADLVEQPAWQAVSYGNLGNVYQTRGDLDKAEEMHLKSLEINEKLGRLEGMANQYGNLGNVYQTRGDLEKAEEYWGKAKRLFIEIGIPDKAKMIQHWLDTLKDEE